MLVFSLVTASPSYRLTRPDDTDRNRPQRANRRIDELHADLAEERRRVIAILTDQRRRPWWPAVVLVKKLERDTVRPAGRPARV